jgi:hypothetical protein
VIRTVFHPETSNADFVGTYTPVCGSDREATIRDAADGADIPRPVVYYQFRPGPLSRALVAAKTNAPEPVALILEEINRGDCAAIFGEFFQLLDRRANGESQYGIQVGDALGRFLTTHGVIAAADDEVRLPANLWVLATMNTSDQGLYAMDAAFKRRWKWRSVAIDAGASRLSGVKAGSRTNAPEWTHFVSALNKRIVESTRNEDKQLGLWYIRAVNGVIPDAELREKLLFYLWHDVFRGRRDAIFSDSVTTFDELQRRFDSHGLAGVFDNALAAVISETQAVPAVTQPSVAQRAETSPTREAAAAP